MEDNGYQPYVAVDVKYEDAEKRTVGIRFNPIPYAEGRKIADDLVVLSGKTSRAYLKKRHVKDPAKFKADDDPDLAAEATAAANDAVANARLLRTFERLTWWDVKDEHGKDVPLTVEAFALQGPQVFLAVEAVVYGHALGRWETDKKKSPSPPESAS